MISKSRPEESNSLEISFDCFCTFGWEDGRDDWAEDVGEAKSCKSQSVAGFIELCCGSGCKTEVPTGVELETELKLPNPRSSFSLNVPVTLEIVDWSDDRCAVPLPG